MSGRNAEKKISPKARRKIQRTQRCVAVPSGRKGSGSSSQWIAAEIFSSIAPDYTREREARAESALRSSSGSGRCRGFFLRARRAVTVRIRRRLNRRKTQRRGRVRHFADGFAAFGKADQEILHIERERRAPIARRGGGFADVIAVGLQDAGFLGVR